MPSFSSSAPRKWDSEITKARRHDTWLAFEAEIHQSAADGQTGTVRARVARALDRYGLGTSDVVTRAALSMPGAQKQIPISNSYQFPISNGHHPSESSESSVVNLPILS